MNLIKVLLFPLQAIYRMVIQSRNILYNLKVLKTNTFNTHIISVGNLKTGGTGKTPMTEFIVSIMSPLKTAVVSRGYKRHTNKFILANKNHSSKEIGDENRQLIQKFPHLIVACDVNRSQGVENLLKHHHDIDVIILDDAYQHRKINRDLDIVLTEYDDLYTNDCLLPIGNLREPIKEIKRTNIIVVTKCPKHITKQETNNVIKKLKPKYQQKVYFSYIKNYSFKDDETKSNNIYPDKDKTHILVTGIANPKHLINFLSKKNLKFKHVKYSDHYFFQEKDVENIINLKLENKFSNLLLTTEKDYYRLSDTQKHKLKKHFKIIPIQMTIDFIDNDKDNFINQLLNFKKI